MKLNFNPQQGILSVTVTGRLTIEDVETSMQEVLTSDEYPHDVNTLWDIRDMNFNNIDIDFIKRMVGIRKKHDGMRGDAKIAIVSNYVLAAPIVKLYMILSKGLSQKNSVFVSVEEAELWLSDTL